MRSQRGRGGGAHPCSVKGWSLDQGHAIRIQRGMPATSAYTSPPQAGKRESVLCVEGGKALRIVKVLSLYVLNQRGQVGWRGGGEGGAGCAQGQVVGCRYGGIRDDRVGVNA